MPNVLCRMLTLVPCYQETLREYYKRMSKDPDMTWDKTKSIRDGRNARIVNNMIAYIRGLEQHLNNNTSGDTGENPRRMHWTDHQIFAKAQNQLEYHKATADLTDELRKKHSAKVAKRNARKKVCVAGGYCICVHTHIMNTQLSDRSNK